MMRQSLWLDCCGQRDTGINKLLGGTSSVGGLWNILEKIYGIPGYLEDWGVWQKWVESGKYGMNVGTAIFASSWVLFLVGLLWTTSHWWMRLFRPKATEEEKDEFNSLVGILRADMSKPNIRQARRVLRDWQTRDFTREPNKSMRDDILIVHLQYLGMLENRLRELVVGTPSTTKEGFDDKEWGNYLVSVEVLASQRKLDEARRTWPLEEYDG